MQNTYSIFYFMKKTKELFHRYITGNISAEMFSQLTNSIKKADESDLEEILREEWMSYETGLTFRNEKEQIKKQLDNLISQRKRFAAGSYIISFYRIAAAVLLPILVSGLIYLTYENRNFRDIAGSGFKVSTTKGERSQVILPDGSKVYLNAASSLIYSTSVTDKIRSVTLSGEAYFDVVHNPQKPFVVKTGVADIKVLGTSFNVCNYPNEDIVETSLISGSVEVIASNARIVLKPNEKASLNKKTKTLTISKTDLWFETAWRRGDLVFRSTTIQEVFERLEIYYGINIITHNKSPEELFTGSFHDDTVNGILYNLQQHYNFEFSKKGNDINITFN